MEATQKIPESGPREAILAAAERMLIEDGYAAITTRKLATAADVNPGLIHYYFGSMEEVLLQVFEHFSTRLLERQRAMYAADIPFVEKWRSAMAFLEKDIESGYPKVWLELQALAWNNPDLQERVRAVHAQWWQVLLDAFAEPFEKYGLADGPLSLEAWVALVATFNQGIELERLSGTSPGHSDLLAGIERWLTEHERQTKR